MENRKSDHVVDIIMPTYNPGEWLCRSIESIRTQTFGDWRLIVVDDGSSSSCRVLIQDAVSSDQRITLITHERNLGGGAARNTALAACTGEYVAFCDSDDIWPAEKLEKQIRFMRENDVKMSHGDLMNFFEVPKSLGELKNKNLARRVSQEATDINTFLRNPRLFFSSVIIRADSIGNARFGTMKARHPFRFLCMVLSSGITSIKCPDCYYFYYVRQGSVSSNKLKMMYYTILAYLLYAPSYYLAIMGLLSRAKVLLTSGESFILRKFLGRKA